MTTSLWYTTLVNRRKLNNGGHNINALLRTGNLTGIARHAILDIGGNRPFILFIPAYYINEAGIEAGLAPAAYIVIKLNFCVIVHSFSILFSYPKLKIGCRHTNDYKAPANSFIHAVCLRSGLQTYPSSSAVKRLKYDVHPAAHIKTHNGFHLTEPSQKGKPSCIPGI
jgi:hypothetical protein